MSIPDRDEDAVVAVFTGALASIPGRILVHSVENKTQWDKLEL